MYKEKPRASTEYMSLRNAQDFCWVKESDLPLAFKAKHSQMVMRKLLWRKQLTIAPLTLCSRVATNSTDLDGCSQ